MNKRILNFAEYLKEELKIDLSDKKFKENLEALLAVADQAIYDYCSKKKPYGEVINELMEMDGYADSIAYGVAAMLLSGMDRSELKDLKEGDMPNVKFVVTGHKGSVRVKKDTMYKSNVKLEQDDQKIENDQFKIINAPGKPGEMEASQFLIKITEKNVEDLISAVEDKKQMQLKEISQIKNVGGKFSLDPKGVYNPLKALIITPRIQGFGKGAKLVSKTPYLQSLGSSAEKLDFKLEETINKESQFDVESAVLKGGFADEVVKEIEAKIENAKKQAAEKLGKDADFKIIISKLEVLSSSSNVWGKDKLNPTGKEMDFEDESRTETENTKKNDDLAKARAESFESAITDELREKKLLGEEIEVSKKWKVTDTGGKTDEYNKENKTGKEVGQYVEVRMTLEATGETTKPGDLSAYLKYSRIELSAGFYFGEGGEDFLDMKGWEFSRPKYTRKGPFKNVDFGKSLNVKGLPWWLTKGKGGGGRDWIGGRS
jgi:hypothetical protein